MEYSLIDGKQAADEILSHKFNFKMYKKITTGVTAAMTGQSIDEVEKAAQDAKAGGRFPAGKGKRI